MSLGSLCAAAQMNVTGRDECQEIFKECKRRGVTLFLENEDLGYKPKARMSRGLLYKIKQNKESVVRLLASPEPEDGLGASTLNSSVLIVPANGPRKTPFELEPDTDRDKILRRALTHLSEHGVEYVPLAIEEDIQASYEDDTLEDFRETVRGWMRELRNAGRGAA